MGGVVTAGVVRSVEAGSPACLAGITAGDCITAVNGHVIVDVFDWLWRSAGDELELTLLDAGGERSVTLARDCDDTAWGIEFDAVLFDGTRLCQNSCAFCFMDQLPAGLRESLTLKDDDYRLSFWEGNFVTLTNLSDADIERIVAQKLSPLYVSFHAVDPVVRQRLVGQNHVHGITAFERLVAGGIALHVSIVLVPGINDGAVLDETLTYLQNQRPAVQSVGIVPVAYTTYTDTIAGGLPRSYTDRANAARVIEQVQSYQFRSREETGLTWVYLADEFYLYAQAPFPTTEWYDGYPQYENGIGIVHAYIEDIRAHLDELTASVATLAEQSDALTLVTGELTRDTLLGTLSALQAGGRIRVLPVKNEFFGGNVSVTGLLCGVDIARAIAYDHGRHTKPTTYVIPWTVLNDDEVTLDDYTPERISEEAGASLLFVSDDARGLLEAIEEVNA